MTAGALIKIIFNSLKIFHFRMTVINCPFNLVSAVNALALDSNIAQSAFFIGSGQFISADVKKSWS